MALLKNKIAIITGAAGGIGRTVAWTLAKEKCNLVLIDRSSRDLALISKKIKKYHFQSLHMAIDVLNREKIKGMVDEVIKRFSKIDILINAAGIYGPIGPFVDSNLDKWIKTININLIGSVLCTKIVLPFMIKQKSGKIINFSGGGAFNPRPNFSAYATSKAAVARLTETLAEEVKEYNIQINAISPGAVNTRMLEEALRAGPKLVGKEFYKKIKKQKIDGGDPAQLAADLIVFLASEKSYNLSGKLISAKWDNWREWDKKKIKDIMKSSDYTLRRIDNKYFKEIKK